ncbi:MFS transporter [Zafaria sp. Z1313]|uniref:MFS transporter n=1 Tax=unclassified Zafaria TaxID=2828765 RepID=UPI002E77E644|nr:MFS transporter [Zafaria sp. J156]MEE1620183.1 MFS transporter [Zafaria sp. J156]
MAEHATTAPGARRQAVQRRVVATLAAAQLFSGIGNGAGLAIGSLMAVELTGSNAFAGASTTAISVAGALAALPLAGLAARRGRRTALSAGLLLAAAGAVAMAAAPLLGSFAALLAGSLLLGVGAAANLQARFAATDLADDATRGRDVGLVVWSITVGAVAGPNLIGPGSAWGASLGLPPLSGPFLFSLAGLLAAAVVLQIGLRPDPLAFGAEIPADAGRGGSAAGGPEGVPAFPAAAPGRPSLRDGVRAVRDSPAARLGIATVVGAHLVMVSVMAMTPVHLRELAEPAGHAGHAASPDTLVLIGFTISLHIAGMYALSPVMGWMADRLGRRRTMLAAQCVLAAALVTAGLGRESHLAVAAGLVLLGLGWSMAVVAASAFLAESVDGRRRVLVQGLSDTLMGAAGALGAAGSGVVLAWVGFTGLNLAALAVAAGVALWCAASLRTGRPRRVPAA